MLKESLRMSLLNIRSNRMRSFLTVLGIIIGVMAIIALITVMHSATGEVTAQFENLGTGKLSVQATGTPLKSGLTEGDLERLSDISGVWGVSPTLSQQKSVVAGGEVLEDVLIEGYGYAWFRRESDAVARGRALLPPDEEQRSRVCLIDSDLAAALFSGTDPIGQAVLVEGTRFTVVGVLKDADVDDVMSQLQAGDESGTLIMPYTSYMRLFGVKGITSLEVYLDSAEQTDAVSEEMEGVLEAAFNYREDSYRIINMESLLDVMDTMMGLMTNLLVGIASIALLVGGIGIMNAMLVSIAEAHQRNRPARKATGRAAPLHTGTVSHGKRHPLASGRAHRRSAGPCGQRAAGRDDGHRIRAVPRRHRPGRGLLAGRGRDLRLGARAQGQQSQSH